MTSVITLLTTGIILSLANWCWAMCVENIAKASIGEPLTLSCDAALCPSRIYLWHNVTEAKSQPLSNTRELRVSKNVTTVREVGGQNYTCQCNSTTREEDCYSFWIWVRPQVNLTILPPVAKLNSSASIVCTAESYPPANYTHFFHLLSPHGQRISSIQAVSVGTGVEYHVAHVNRSYGGEYECFVSIDIYSEGLQSNTVNKTLIVYDPPRIKRIQNFTLYSEPHGVESAVLECEVENKEAKLEVWVNWTTWSKAVVDQKACVCGAAEHTVVFFLVIHNVTKEDVGLYTCQLFSTYSSNKAEDQRTAHIRIADTEICGGTSEIPTSEGATTKTEEGNCAREGTIVGFVTMVVTSIFWIISCFVVYISRRRCSRSVHPEAIYEMNTMSHGNTADNERYVDIHSVSPPTSPACTQGLDSTGTDSDSTNQSVPTPQRSTSEPAPPNQTSAQGHLAITNPVAAGSEEMPSGSTEDSPFSNDTKRENSVANTQANDTNGSHVRKRSPTSSTSN